MSELTSTIPRGIRREGAFALFSAGRQAFREVPGLRWLLIRGFLLIYGLFIALGAALTGAVYWYAVQPISQWMGTVGEGGESWFWNLALPMLTLLVWLGQAMLLAASLVLSLVLTLALMSFWFEVLTERIVIHCRGSELEGKRFTLIAWARGLLRSLRDGLRLLLLAVASLFLGFIPVVGPFLVLAVTAFLLGWEVREPYLIARESMGEEPRALRKGLWLWTIRIGLLPTFLAMVPWLGWMLLPLVLIYLVAGVAWSSEQG